jgi:phage tail-like protein
MARMTPQTNRFDPYRTFRFKVKWDNQYVAGLTKMGALRRTTEMVEYREAGENITSRKLPGKTSYQAVTLEAGVTYDSAFKDWANLVNDFASHSITSLGEFRKNIIVDVFNEAGVKALSYVLYRCWVSEYQALPDLDPGANAVAITTLKLEYEWFERDESVVEAQGPARVG